MQFSGYVCKYGVGREERERDKSERNFTSPAVGYVCLWIQIIGREEKNDRPLIFVRDLASKLQKKIESWEEILKHFLYKTSIFFPSRLITSLTAALVNFKNDLSSLQNIQYIGGFSKNLERERLTALPLLCT